MVKVDVKCPYCKDINVVTHGFNVNGVRRYRCCNKDCSCNTFMLEYAYNGWKPGIDEQIIKQTSNSSGIRDIARNLSISKQKVQDTLKKQRNT